jgi:hypothetical protein
MFKLFKNLNFSKINLKSKFPLLVSGLMLNAHLKRNFSLARLFEQRYFVRIINDKDIDDLKKSYMKELENAQSVQVELRNNQLSNDKFNELFEVLSKTNKEEMHLDLSNTNLDDKNVESLTKCMNNWKLKNLSLHLSNIKLTDDQYEKVMKALEGMKSLKILHLEMENVDMNNKKRMRIENIIENLPELSHVSINLRNNNITEEDANYLNRLLDRFAVRHFFF